MFTTTPVAFSPVFKVLIDFSSSSAKDSSISRFSSLILSLTSFIIHPGVDAPAVIPTQATSFSADRSSSDACSTHKTVGQCARHSSTKCLVLELAWSPMTTIAPHFSAILTASDCLQNVALHIVSNISRFVHTFFAKFTEFSQISLVEVVWETKVSGFSRLEGSSSSHFCRDSTPSSTTG